MSHDLVESVVARDRTARDDHDVRAIAAALHHLTRHAACCGGDSAPGPRLGDAPATGDASHHRQAPHRRGHHRTAPTARRFVLPQVHVIEPAERREVADVLVADGRVVDVVPPGSGPYEGYDVLAAYRDCFVVPALVDMHVHVPPNNILGLIDLFLLLFMAHGVTTVRDAGDPDGTALPETRDGLATKRFIGPRVFGAGPFVNKGAARWKNTLELHDAGDADAIARALVARGARCMKLYENLSVPEIAALERAAANHGLVTLGHVPTHLGFEEAPLADAQHFFGVPPPASLARDHVLDRTMTWDAVDDRRMDAIVRAAVEGGRANTPTLVVTERLVAAGPTGRLEDPSLRLLPRFFRDVVWHPAHGLPAYRDPDARRIERLKAALDRKLALVERLHRAGARLHVGTDFQPFSVPGSALHMEMKLFARAGIPAPIILKMATRDAALALGEPDLGVIRKGAIADLIVCDADPERDLAALGSIRGVAHAGAFYASDALWREIDDDLARRDRAFARVTARVLAQISVWATARRFVG
jgi:hypothetical protein